MATVPKSVLHRIEVNKSRKVAAAEQFRSWQERWRSAPQREGVQHCTQEGCVKKGVYVSFRQDDGILFCRDCAHAAQQGLFGELCQPALRVNLVRSNAPPTLQLAHGHGQGTQGWSNQ